MPIEASLPADQFIDVLRRLPPDLDLESLAANTGALVRRREVRSAETLLRLILARGPGGLSLNQTAVWAEALGVAKMSDPAIKKRLDNAVGFLNAILERNLAANPVARPLRWPGRTIRIADGTTISRPGSKGTDWRIHGVYDLGQGGFSHLELTDKHGGEALARGAPEPGEIRIADRNYCNLHMLRKFLRDGAGKADFITRIRWQAFNLSLPDGSDFDLFTWLRGLPEAAEAYEIAMQASTKSDERPAPLPLRLIAWRKSPEAADKERKRLRQIASRKGRKLDPRTLEAAGWVLIVTSLGEGYAAADILDAYRLRWQIELAFKRMKSLIHIDQLPTRSEDASRSWLLSFLLMTTLCDDMNQEILESFP